jgi:plastocyanin
MVKQVIKIGLICALATSGHAFAQENLATKPAAELRLRIASSTPGKHRAVPAVMWLEPLQGTPALTFAPNGHYALLQKNRSFSPHLQVIPVGSVVSFPNADPFFHNVFSLFEGKKFDLGLYEAGSSRSVTFSREGASYIFCNIHPEMSAVVLALSTPLYALAGVDETSDLRRIPPGDYRMHLWIEGVPQATLEGLRRNLHFPAGVLDVGTVSVSITPPELMDHTNKFGKPYDSHTPSAY